MAHLDRHTARSNEVLAAAAGFTSFDSYSYCTISPDRAGFWHAESRRVDDGWSMIIYHHKNNTDPNNSTPIETYREAETGFETGDAAIEYAQELIEIRNQELF